MRSLLTSITLASCAFILPVSLNAADDRLIFEPVSTGTEAKSANIVLISGDEEYRTEETMPMLAKILSKQNGFRCTVLFSLSEDGSYIDSNNPRGVVGWETLDEADLLIIGTRFREPTDKQAQHLTRFLNAGKPVIGIRTSTHAFKGKGTFGTLPYNDFGLKILGETWVSHHGKHKVEGGRSAVESGREHHPILSGVGEIFTASDIYGVIHLTDSDEVLLRGAVTESLDPQSPNVAGEKNQPMQALAWLRKYPRPDSNGYGRSFCTTAGASVDFIDEDLRRLVVNATFFLLDLPVPEKADVSFVDPFTPSFYGFIKSPNYWKELDLQPSDFATGKSPQQPDPPGSPAWPYR
jgi:hypothetical protein